MKNSEIYKKWACIIQGHKYKRTTAMTFLCVECGTERPLSKYYWKPVLGGNKICFLPSKDSDGTL